VVRTERLLTIRGLAQQAGVAPSTVYLIEAGRTVPRLSMVRRLATALGMEPAAVDEFRQAIAAAQAPRPTGGSHGED
jgi:transcriptional regulator with XRE-family HTH domain